LTAYDFSKGYFIDFVFAILYQQQTFYFLSLYCFEYFINTTDIKLSKLLTILHLLHFLSNFIF